MPQHHRFEFLASSIHAVLRSQQANPQLRDGLIVNVPGEPGRFEFSMTEQVWSSSGINMPLDRCFAEAMASDWITINVIPRTVWPLVETATLD